MKFKLEISCDNAAFGDGMHATNLELARMLRVLASSLQDDGYSNGPLRDYNGNTVGKYWFESGGKADV